MEFLFIYSNQILINFFNVILIYRHAASSAICVLNSEIYSGSDTGQIVRIQPESRASHSVRLFATDLMGTFFYD